LYGGDPVVLRDGDVIVLAGAADFVFHPLEYEWWQLFQQPSPSSKAPRGGWALLIDGNRRLALPLTRDEEFIVPDGERGVEPRERREGAIAVVRRVRGRPMYSRDKGIVELFLHPPDVDPRVEISLLALAPAQPSTSSDASDFLTIEKIADGEPLQADVKLDDNSYGRLTIPPSRQYFGLQSPRGVRDHSVTELAFHQGERRFQVIRRDPDIEPPPAP
jgi:hypothetical protein